MTSIHALAIADVLNREVSLPKFHEILAVTNIIKCILLSVISLEYSWKQWRNEPNIWGGHNLCEGAKRPSRGSVATERGEGGVPPPTVKRFSFFDLEMCNLGHT